MSSSHHLNSEESKQVKENATKLLPELRKTLGDLAEDVSDENLLKFLHWKPDVTRASERFKSHVQWRKANPFFMDDNPPLVSKDPTLKRLLENEIIVSPKGYVDNEGNSVLFGRLRNNDMTDGRTPEEVVRMVLYMIDKVLENENAQINGVTIFHDMKGLARKNIHPTIPKLIIGAIIGNFPIRIQGMYVLNAPFFFFAIFKIVSLLMPVKLRQRIHFLKDLSEIPISKDNLLPEHGGTKEFDVKQWVQEQIEREKNDSISSLASIPISS